MVASNQSDSLRVSYFKRKQQQKGLHRVEASIDEIPHKEVVGIGTVAANLKQLHKVVELSVNVTADLKITRNLIENYCLQ